MSLSIKQLNTIRYKVIADYPNSRLEIGEILTKYKFESSDTGMYVYTTNLEIPLRGINIKPDWAENYPHLFRKLEWWEDREVEDMPQYLKETGMVDDDDNPIADWYLKVKKHFNAGNGEWRDNSIRIF